MYIHCLQRLVQSVTVPCHCRLNIVKGYASLGNDLAKCFCVNPSIRLNQNTISFINNMSKHVTIFSMR